MKAVVKYGQKPDMVELCDVPVPRVRSGAVLVEVKAAGVCGWDIEMWRHRMAYPVTVPVIQGHEFSGIIAEVGAEVQGWVAGDRVVAETSASVCGKCRWCVEGEYQICPERKGFGYGVDGAFTKYVVVRQEILHPIPEQISFEEAALTEPFCVAHHALVDMVTVRPGDTVAVIGPGPMGMTSVQMARVLGARQVFLIGNDASVTRMKIAEREAWADKIINVNRENPPQAVLDLTEGEGADVVVDAAGNSAALKTALDCVRRLGHIVKIGWGPQPFEESLDPLLRKSATLAGTFGHNWHNWEAVLELMKAGRLDARSLITDTVPLSQWRKAFIRAESLEALKMVLTPED